MGKKLTDAQKELILGLHIEGVSQASIVEITGISKHTVARVICEFRGVPIPAKSLRMVGISRSVKMRCKGCGGLTTEIPCKTCQMQAKREAEWNARAKAYAEREVIATDYQPWMVRKDRGENT